MTHSFPLAAWVFNQLERRDHRGGFIVLFLLMVSLKASTVHISRQVIGAALKKTAVEKEAWMEIVRSQHWQHVQPALSLFAVIFLLKKMRV